MLFILCLNNYDNIEFPRRSVACNWGFRIVYFAAHSDSWNSLIGGDDLCVQIKSGLVNSTMNQMPRTGCKIFKSIRVAYFKHSFFEKFDLRQSHIHIYIPYTCIIYIYQLQNRKGCRVDPLSGVTWKRLKKFSQMNSIHYTTYLFWVNSMSRNTATHCLLM